MKDLQSVRYNEKVKRLSTLIGGGGLAFILTALTRALDRNLDLLGAAWILTGIALIFISVQMNELLDSEDQGMTIGEIATVIVPSAIAGSMYLYILNERRKLRQSRTHRLHPAE